MTTLIVGAGGASEAAAAALSDAGVPVEQVATIPAARDDLADADVVVVGEPEDASADDVRVAAPADVPLVRIGADDRFETTVPRPVDGEVVVRAVRLAERVRTYRAAVDELYRLCRERAAGEPDEEGGEAALDRELTDARRRAERAFRGAKRLAEEPPYGRLIGTTVGPVDGDTGAFAELGDAEAGREDVAGEDERVDDPLGQG